MMVYGRGRRRRADRRQLPGPSSTKKNLVLVDGATGKVIRWYNNSPTLKSVLAAPGRPREGLRWGGESLGVRLRHGQEALDQSEDHGRPHHTHPRQQSGLSRPRARRRRPDDLGSVHLRRGERNPAKALVKLDIEGNHDARG